MVSFNARNAPNNEILVASNNSLTLRMADFAILGTALEKILHKKSGTFLAVYKNNHALSIESTIDGCPIIGHLVDFIKTEIEWTGRYSDLLDVMTIKYMPKRNTTWPETPKGMATTIKRYIPLLEMLNIIITEIEPRKEDGLYINIRFNVQKVQDEQLIYNN